MTPERMEKAGKVLNQMNFTDEDLKEAIAALDLVIPFMQGAGYHRRIWGSLNQEREAMLSFQQVRKRHS